MNSSSTFSSAAQKLGCRELPIPSGGRGRNWGMNTSHFHCSRWPRPWEGQQNLKEESWWGWYCLGLELPAADRSLLYACFLLLCWAKGNQSRRVKRARQEPKRRVVCPSDVPSAGGRTGQKVPILTGPDGGRTSTEHTGVAVWQRVVSTLAHAQMTFNFLIGHSCVS